jgi:hypothetical protein
MSCTSRSNTSNINTHTMSSQDALSHAADAASAEFWGDLISDTDGDMPMFSRLFICESCFHYEESRILRDIAIYDFVRSTSPEPPQPCGALDAKPYVSAEMMVPFAKLMGEPWFEYLRDFVKPKDTALFYSIVQAYFSAFDMAPTTSRQRLGPPSTNEVIADFSYTGNRGEMSFEKGEIISVSGTSPSGGWWTGRIGDRRGRVPS